jgi:hypothetical protein
MLQALRHDWAPAAMIVSFKLETDESILLAKVRWASRCCGKMNKADEHVVQLLQQRRSLHCRF